MRRTAASDLKERKSNRMTSSEGAPLLPPSVPPRSTRTIRFDELPEWAKDNHFILRGYRTADTYWLCASSIFSHIHNETVNIWSHLVGSLAALVALVACYVLSEKTPTSTGRLGWRAPFTLIRPFPSPALPSVTYLDSAVVCIFFLSAATCLGFSATFHTLHCHSMRVSHYWNRLDYIGIVVLISGTFVPLVHYGWYCAPRLRDFYLAMISLASACTIAVVVSPNSRTPAFRRTRTYTFIALGTSAVFPVGHAIIRYGLPAASDALGLPFVVLGGALYIVGALLYAERCPESLSPEVFDFFGSSHQLFHVAILLAAWSHCSAIAEAHRFWHEDLAGDKFGWGRIKKWKEGEELNLAAERRASALGCLLPDAGELPLSYLLLRRTSNAALASKSFDIIVWGASGFTGQLVIRYLSTVAGDIKWAVGGRNKAKIEVALKEAGVDVPIVLGDAANEESLVKMVKQTRLVISLVGPYMLYGAPLVKACAENGVHYVDLTGEAPFVADMIKAHARSAVSTRALMLHSCGYDSVPSDLCAFLAVQRLKKIAGERVKVGEVSAAFSLQGGASGGTLASLLEMLESGPEAQKIARNPFCLSPIAGNHNPPQVFVTSSTFQRVKTWGSFWVMAPHNTAIVRRSWGVLESADASSRVLAYGPEFRYEEFLAAKNPVYAALTSLIVYFGFAWLVFFPPARWALRRFGPGPGEGPSLDQQKNGWFKVATTAKSVDKTQEVQVVMRGKGDPGYSGTAKILVECALTIVKDYDRLPPLAKQGGPLTPATALGNVLVERLEKTGFFSFTSEDAKSK